MAKLGIPLQGQNPPPGRSKEFDKLSVARSFAKKQKDNWDMVKICRRIEPGNLEEIEKYYKGKKEKVMGKIVLIILGLLLAASVAEADCIRCGLDKLVCTGDNKFEAIVACGQPDYTEELGDKVSGAVGGGAFVASEKKREKMYYNCGDGRFIKILLISNGKIIRIDDGERGSGPVRCD